MKALCLAKPISLIIMLRYSIHGSIMVQSQLYFIKTLQIQVKEFPFLIKIV